MKKFNKDQLIEDFNFMFKTFKEVHPDIYSIVDKKKMKEEADKIRATLSDGMTIIDFYNKIGKFVSSIKDGHTFIYLFNNYLYKHKDFKFFYPILLFNEKKAKFKNNIEDIAKIGDEVLEINGISMEFIITEMLKYNSAETESFQYTQLTGKYQLLLYFLFNIKSPFKIKIKRDDKVFETELKGKSITDFEKEEKSKKETSSTDYFEEKFKIENGTGIFTIKTFGYHKEKADKFKRFVDKSFEEMKIKNIIKLIFDVRQNGGGNSSMANYITNYLTEKPTYSFDRLIWKSSQQMRDLVNDDITNNTIGSYDQDSYDRLLSVKLGDCLVKDCKSYKNPNAKEKTYRGDVFVLSDEACFSTTSDFIAMVKDFKLGKIVGQTPGGLPNTFGDCYYFDLPNTKIMISVSHKYFVRPSGNEKDNDLIPDYIVEQTIEDSKRGIDTVMEFTKKL